MKTFLIALTFIWSGLILGISFMEAPLKFQAPNITTELGLGIGKLVFTALNRIELIIAGLVIVCLWRVKASRQHWLLYSIPLVILAIQTSWLLPVLNGRIESILAGNVLPNTYHHLVFIFFEVVKLLSLWVAGRYFLKGVLNR